VLPISLTGISILDSAQPTTYTSPPPKAMVSRLFTVWSLQSRPEGPLLPLRRTPKSEAASVLADRFVAKIEKALAGLEKRIVEGKLSITYGELNSCCGRLNRSMKARIPAGCGNRGTFIQMNLMSNAIPLFEIYLHKSCGYLLNKQNLVRPLTCSNCRTAIYSWATLLSAHI